MNRRHLIGSAKTLVAGLSLMGMSRAKASEAKITPAPSPRGRMNFAETKDGTQLFYRSWGTGPPIVFVSAWALHSEAWQYQMTPLCDEGFRCVAFDRRSHGRSSDPGTGYDLDTLADDLASVLTHLNLTDVTLVGHSLGGRRRIGPLSYASWYGANRALGPGCTHDPMPNKERRQS
jgi:hypothetical protein